MKTIRRSRSEKRQRGAALMELAITLPLFFVMVFGMLEYGYFFYVAVTASNAAREGARQCTLAAAGACKDCNPTSAIDYMSSIGMAHKTTAKASCATKAGTFMYTVDVTVDYPTITRYLPILGTMPASTVNGNTVAHAFAVMRGQ